MRRVKDSGWIVFITSVAELTTLVAAGSEQHLEVVFAVFPAFKLSTGICTQLIKANTHPSLFTSTGPCV
uniref:Uncharacterized protein n=1 Tax=Gasterosteus aculeatus aculeatus TaxID=481459 RepID=A0AAQ4RHE5_GASAC